MSLARLVLILATLAGALSLMDRALDVLATPYGTHYTRSE